MASDTMAIESKETRAFAHDAGEAGQNTMLWCGAIGRPIGDQGWLRGWGGAGSEGRVGEGAARVEGDIHREGRLCSA